MLHRALHFPHRIARQHAHQNRARGFAAPGATDKKAFALGSKAQQRQQHIAGIALGARQSEPRLFIADDKLRRRLALVFDIVMRRKNRGVDDPKIGLA